jgi:putative hydrolase of the HAD superfamily
MKDNAALEAVRVIAFDADDTLWHNESLFALSQQSFRELLSPYVADGMEHIDQRLFATEIRNLQRYGYGIKGFTLSMIETAIDLTDGRITGIEIKRLIDLAHGMLAAPVELLEGVAETVATLAERGYTLMVITKGDLFDQESKLARSGLGDHFRHVEIVSEKDERTYRALLTRHGIAPGEFLMVGNSVRSDILPVLAVGGRAVHVPYHITWQHEAVAVPPEGDGAATAGGYARIERMGELLGLLPV